jgi:hypothetical protein
LFYFDFYFILIFKIYFFILLIVKKLSDDDKNYIRRFYSDSFITTPYQIQHEYLISPDTSEEEKIDVVVNFGQKLRTKGDPGYIWEYEKWREMYESVKVGNRNKTTKEIKERGVDTEYLMLCGLKAINLREKFGEDFAKAVKLIQTSLHDIKKEKLIEYIEELQ